MKDARPATRIWWKILRFVLYTCCFLILLTAAVGFALTLPAVQQKITDKATSFLREKLGTRVELGAVRLHFPYNVSLEKLLLEDQQGDTLARIGSLNISVDMWQLLNQTIEFQKVSLEDAGVYLHKKDSIYNFDFVTQAFAKSKTPKPKPEPVDSGSSPWKIQLDLTVLQLKNVAFLLNDEDAESITQANVGSLETVIKTADLKTTSIELDGLRLSDSDIRLIDKKKSTPSGKPSPAFALLLSNADISRSHLFYSTPERSVDANLESTKLGRLKLQSANDALAIESQNIQVQNSRVAYRDPEAIATLGHLNAGDMDFSQLNADIPVFSFQNDTLYLQANSLTGNDKSGLQIHSLRAITRVTPGSIELKEALATMNRTSLDGDVVLYKNDKASFDRMKVDLRHVKGYVDDLDRAIPPQKNPALAKLHDMPFEVSGNISGWLQNLQMENMRFLAGQATVAYFRGSVQNLTEPDKLGMNLNITRMESNRADLLRFMSLGDTPMDSLLAQPLPAYVNVSGDVSGNMAKLELTLGGEIGALQTSAAPADTSGSVLQFDISGSLTQVNNPDSMGMDLTLNGVDAPRNFFAFLEPKGLRFPDHLEVTGTLQGPLAALQTDLQVKAQRGSANSSLAFKGLIKNIRTPDQLGFDANFDALLARSEILGYVPDSVVTNVLRLPEFTQVKGNAKGTTKNANGLVTIGLGALGQIQMNGSLRDSTYDMDLRAQNLQVSQLAVSKGLQPLKTIGFNAHVTGTGFQIGKTASMQLTGKFDSLIWDNIILRDITLDADLNGKRFEGGLQSTDERAAVVMRATGDFSTDIPVLETDITLNCVDLREFGWSSRPTTVCMHITSHSEGLSLDTLTANIKIEKIDLQYDTVHIHPGALALDIKLDNHHNNINIVSDWLKGEIKGFFNLADLSTTIDNIAEQYFVVDRTAYVPKVGTDSLFVELFLLKPEVLSTGLVPGLTELGPVHLDGSLIAQRNYFDLKIQAPRIVYLEWDVDSLNVRAYAGDTAALFVVTSPIIKRGDKDFIENAEFNGRFQRNIANVSFKASDDAGRERFLLVLEGLIDGKKKETLVTLAPRQVIDFKEWTVSPDNQISIKPEGVLVKNFNMSGNGQTIKVEGSTRKTAAGKTELDFAVDIDRLNYNNFDIFVAGILSDFCGWAEAHLKIKGNTDAMQVRGKLQLHEAFFTPALTNVRYELSDTPIEFTESGVTLDGLTLRDPYGKTLEVKGKLTTSDWKKIGTNLTLHADRWQVLNSTKRQNPVYFGELYVSLDGTIRGDVTQPDIQLTVKTAKESTFTYIYDAATRTLQHEGIVYFIAPPREYVRPPIYDAPVKKQAYTLSASIEIDSNLTINSVINPVTGDDFRGKAIGRLQFDQLANGNMTLAGRVELVRGVYNYSYQSVVKRSFNVTEGSTITWTGDPTRPELDLKARYQFKASPYPLVSNQLLTASPEEAAAYRSSQLFYLQTTINGSAREPDVDFQFIYPSAEKQESLSSSLGSQETGLVQGALSNVNEDKNQLSRQVFGVLLLRSFIAEDLNPGGSLNGRNPLQSGLTNFLTGQINALADQYLNFIDVEFVTTEGTANPGTAQAEGTTNYQLRLQKSFFDDRLTFKISGGTSVGNTAGDDVHSALENASIEYALTPKGGFKLTVFSERGFELLNASSNNLRNSGAGLIMTKEFGGQ